jgi:hypothetical protein
LRGIITSIPRDNRRRDDRKSSQDQQKRERREEKRQRKGDKGGMISDLSLNAFPGRMDRGRSSLIGGIRGMLQQRTETNNRQNQRVSRILEDNKEVFSIATFTLITFLKLN